MDMVSLTIDGIKVQVPAGTTVLEAARSANIQIPTLCYLKDVNQIGACRMCLVDTGARALAAACVMPVSDGMVVKTNTPAIREARKVTLELLLSNHDRSCLTCVRSRNCELQTCALRARRPSCLRTCLLLPLCANPTSAFSAAAASPPAPMCRRSVSSAPSVAASTPSSSPLSI